MKPDSKDWFSASELAGQPGLPKTVQGVLGAAKRREWKSRKRFGAGGGSEFHYSSLPAETQRALGFEPIAPLPEGAKLKPEESVYLDEASFVSHKIHVQQLTHVIVGVENALKAKGLEVSTEAKAHLIAVLYSITAEGRGVNEPDAEDTLRRILENLS